MASSPSPTSLSKLAMDSTTCCVGSSPRLMALARQLRLYKPPPTMDESEEERRVEESGGKVVSQVGFAESATPIANQTERFRPKRAAVLICLFEGDGGDLRVILTKRSSGLSTHSGFIWPVVCLGSVWIGLREVDSGEFDEPAGLASVAVDVRDDAEDLGGGEQGPGLGEEPDSSGVSDVGGGGGHRVAGVELGRGSYVYETVTCFDDFSKWVFLAAGEVALPGGKADEGDVDDADTATREAREEIGLDPLTVNVVTVLEPFLSKHLLRVIPVIGILSDKKAFKPTPNVAEVDAVFDAPLEMFLKDENRRSEEREWMGDKYLIHYFDHETDDKKYLIWGLTAGILIRAASVVYQRPPAFVEQNPTFKRLADLAQQLLLYKFPHTPHDTHGKSPAEDSTVQVIEDKVVAQELKLNSESGANPVTYRPQRSIVNRAAVLVCLFEGEDGDLRVILTKRSPTLNTHSGEVSLPGGKMEEQDADDTQTALREAEEEIGLDPSLVNVVAVLEPIRNKRGMSVVPVVGILSDKKAFNPKPNAAEVEAIFDAPLEMFLKDENRREEEREWMGDKYLLHFFDYQAENKKYVIWALTAGILIMTASVVYNRPPAFQERKPTFWNKIRH
ncbi:hypothetical protein RJ640_017285 [Escallonia rubra]|uniref:Nudix hydrolase domain-containing protein n=1 Tax=Escallonia rubra TaxID=112253 RepID=A0AA88S976_9ASTE|nr:hypothetical protein RJ640_017285 [Escallonia rubra]